MKSLFRLLVPHRWQLLPALVAALVASSGLLLLPVVVKSLLGSAFARGGIDIGLAPWLELGGGIVLVGASSYLSYVLMVAVAEKVCAGLQREFFGGLLGAAISFHRDHQSGLVIDRFVSGIGDIDFFVKFTIPTAFGVTLLCGGGTAFLFVLEWKLALLLFVSLTATAIMLKAVFRRSRRAVEEDRLTSSTLTGIIKEALSGIEVLKAFRAEKAEMDRFRRKQEEVSPIRKMTARSVALVEPVLVSAGVGVLLLTLVYGASLIARHELRPETLIAFILYALLIIPQARLVSLIVLRWQNFQTSLKLIDEIAGAPGEIDGEGTADLPHPVQGEIEFRDVAFRYSGRSPAISNVSFRLEPGECLGIVGATGAGKSTLFGLLLRFYDPQRGSILIDGADLRTRTRSSVRDAIAVVPQDTVLFDTDIMENIRYGNRHATEEDVVGACRVTGVARFIEALPEDYRTPVGERGIKLSGGERQRIAIARAIVKNAPILLLDEATASIDAKGERELAVAMASAMHGRTTLVIAHRLATVVNLSRIMVLDRGTVVDSGTHAELLSRCPHYQTLVRSQLIGIPLEPETRAFVS